MSKPDDSEQHCTTFDALFQPLEAPLAQQERDHPPHHREVLRFVQFVRLLVSVDPIFIIEARLARQSPERSHNDLPRHGE